MHSKELIIHAATVAPFMWLITFPTISLCQDTPPLSYVLLSHLQVAFSLRDLATRPLVSGILVRNYPRIRFPDIRDGYYVLSGKPWNGSWLQVVTTIRHASFAQKKKIGSIF